MVTIAESGSHHQKRKRLQVQPKNDNIICKQHKTKNYKVGNTQ